LVGKATKVTGNVPKVIKEASPKFLSFSFSLLSDQITRKSERLFILLPNFTACEPKKMGCEFYCRNFLAQILQSRQREKQIKKIEKRLKSPYLDIR
jgi:superfamily II helicase